MREQANNGILTREQFENVYKVLSKAKQAVELAEIVKNVLIGEITLVKELPSDDLDVKLLPCQLNCVERLDLVKKTSYLLEDFSRSNDLIDSSQKGDRITGIVGSKIEQRMQLK